MARGNSPQGAFAGRDVSLDVDRYLLLAGVIALHLMAAVPADQPGWWSIVVLNLSHVAVPVFLVVAGYFLSWQSRGYRRCVTQPIVPLVPLHLFWLGIYIVHYCLTVRPGWEWRPQILFNGGPAYHLWFLPALLIALVLVAVTSKAAGLWGALLVCAILAAIGLSRGALHDVLGMPRTAQRAGILMAPMFVWKGAAIRIFIPDRVDRRMLWVIIGVMIVMQGVENAVLSHLSAGHVTIVRAFPLTMFATAAAVFLAIRSIPASLWPRWLVDQSRRTLGVYAVHLLVIYPIGGGIVPFGPASLSLLVAIVFALSSLIARPVQAIVSIQPGRSASRARRRKRG